MKKNGFTAIIALVFILIIGIVGLYLFGKLSSFGQSQITVTTLKPETNSFFYSNCTFSADGKQTACLKYNKGPVSMTLVVNGKENATYDDVTDLQYSPDSKSLGFIAKKDDKMFVVINNKEYSQYEYAGNLIFSPNSKHYAYCIAKGAYHITDGYSADTGYKTRSIVVDDKEWGDFVSPGLIVNSNCLPVFSPDSSHVVYSTIDRGNNILLIDDRVIDSSTKFFFATPMFSGDGRKIYFVKSIFSDMESLGNPILSDLSGNILKTFNQRAYPGMSYLSVNDDASKLLYVVSTSLPGGYNVNHSLFINDKKITTSEIDYAVLSPDGSNLAYIYNTSGQTVNILDNATSPVAHVMVNNNEVDSFNTFDTRTSQIIFSPDGKYLAYLSATLKDRLNYDPNKSKLVVVQGGKICRIPFSGIPLSTNSHMYFQNEIASPMFSSDEKYITFGSKSSDLNLIWNTVKINMANCQMSKQ